jgi:hypothetical protein
MQQNQLPRVQYDMIQLRGGLDQVTPTLSLPSGYARSSSNFECSINGGYSRIAGYERFDGHASPSDAIYNILSCTITGSVSVGDTINGETSSATAKVIAIVGSDLVVTRATGIFTVGENARVGVTVFGVVTSSGGVSGDGLTDATYRALAADDYRASISAVPGAGAILGVFFFNGLVYAFRGNVGASAVNLYKSSAAGWVQVTFGEELSFNQGNIAIEDGDTVTGFTSGATGVVARVVLQSGAWTSNDATGRLILSSTTGTFVNGEHLYVDGSKHAHAVGTQADITLSAGGRFETVQGNFGGASNNRVYGCDGVNRAFEFDGTTLVPIVTGMASDNPVHVAFHKQHLFLSFGSSLQFSSIGDPYQWSPILGAGEIAMSDEITNLIPLPGDQTSGAMAVYSRNMTSILYGTSSENFQLSTYNTGTGGFAYTAQNLDQSYALDDRGVMGLSSSLNFGNFVTSALTMQLRPFIAARLNLASCSAVNREKGQYRLFFSDGNGLYITMLNGKQLGSMPVQFSNAALVSCEGENSDGTSAVFFGSGNGFVYQLDRGSSFDGQPISASCNLVFNSIRSPRILKRYRKASIEITGNSYSQIQFGYSLGYQSLQIPQPADATYESSLRPSDWDSFIWDNFVWDGAGLSPTEVEMDGTAENVSIRLSSVSSVLQEFTVNSIIVHYTLRRGLR